MKIPKLKIGNLTARIPIVQGGMGVGISLSSLAGTVAANGGIGVISGVEIGFKEIDYFKNKKKANLRALKNNIRKARGICRNGIIGVNLMVALNNFEEMVKQSVKEKVDIIFSGAGLPLNLPKFTKGTNTKIVPIISSAKAAKVICKSWDRRYNVIPDAIVVEGPKAGGHLGFSENQLKDSSYNLKDILKNVISSIESFEKKYNKKIPIIVGGGIHDGKDISEFLKAGASGVQIGSRFVATYECDASIEFKKAYINSKAHDIRLIKSPVGMIGRAISNDYLDNIERGEGERIQCISNCLKPCNPLKAPYCIADALINAQKGNLESGFAFAGANAYKINKITSVKNLMDELIDEANKVY